MRKTYSTSQVARGERLRYWNDLLSSLLAPLEIKPLDGAKLDATATLDQLGQLPILNTASAPACIERRPRHVAQTSHRRFRMLLCTDGRTSVRHGGHELVLDEGDFALLDDATPYRIAFEEPAEMMCVAMKPSTLSAYLPSPTRFCGLAMASDQPLNEVVSAMLVGLWKETGNDLPAEHRPALAKSLLQVIAAAYAVSHPADADRSAIADARRAAIKQYVENNLRSPTLGPTTIAAALGFSRRYLRLLFAAENDNVTAYIRRRRLEECAWELSQPLWQGRSITATASDWGFRSVAHFARAFKNRYGATPTAYKRAQLARLRH